MAAVFTESPVSLDALDDHLKALLRLKIREWVHLSPWFQDIPSIDPVIYGGGVPTRASQPREKFRSAVPTFEVEEECPRRKQSGSVRRRTTRPSLHLNKMY
jgi:hypothetical protein